jgi:microcystin-dependent protein
MSSPYIGEIRIFAGNFAPQGWAFCDGQVLAISDNDVLFNLIGTTYGGDGQSTFALPDLRGRVPIHQGTDAGNTYLLAQNGGVENVTLTTQQIPSHNHGFVASTETSTGNNPGNNISDQNVTIQIYTVGSATDSFNAGAIGIAGGSQPHSNIQPILGVNFIISLFGIFPSQT